MGQEMARKIRSALAAAQVTPKDVADAVGVDPATVRNWRSGKHRPTPEGLAAIARLTGEPVSHFIGDTAPAAPTTPQQHPGVEALAAILRGDRDHAIADAELDDLRDSTWAQPIATPGEALDLLLARRRARRERSGRMRSE